MKAVRMHGYGGVEQVELYRDRDRVVVGGRLAADMGTDEFDIRLSLSPRKLERLRKGLRAVFAGFGTLIEYPPEPGDASHGGGG